MEDIFFTEAAPTNNHEILTMVDELREQLQKTTKKRKHRKSKGKKVKKLDRKLKYLERELERLGRFVQTGTPRQSVQNVWGDIFNKAAPTLVSLVLNGVLQKFTTPPKSRTLYLTGKDGAGNE
jgi:hypothetical protein